jgi:hypothetical protein
MPLETLNKLDAACRQLNTAILLWFAESDPVSIHTLACSAYQIVHDINQHRHGPDLLYDSLVFKDEYRNQVINRLKQAYNFFKHADKDPSGAIEFDPAVTDMFILFTSGGIEVLGTRPDETRGAFNIYYGLSNVRFLSEKGKEKWIGAIPEEERERILNMPKYQFFVQYTHLRRRHELGGRSFAPGVS